MPRGIQRREPIDTASRDSYDRVGSGLRCSRSRPGGAMKLWRVGIAATAALGMSVASLTPVTAAEGPIPQSVAVRQGFLGAWDIVVAPPAGDRLLAPRVNVRIRVLDSGGDWLVADWDACSAFPEGSRCYADAYVFKPSVTPEVPYEFSVRIRGEGTEWGPWSRVQALPIWENSLLPEIPVVGPFWEAKSIASLPIAKAVGEAPGCVTSYTWSTRKNVVVAKVKDQPGCGAPGMVVLTAAKRTWTVVERTPAGASPAERRVGVRTALTRTNLPRQAVRDAGRLVTIAPGPSLCSSVSSRCMVSTEPAGAVS